jgi:uncharacterized protein
MEAFQLPSHGALLNTIVYVAPGAGPHPVVILLHGFPGNEKNLDLAQAIRRAGWDVLYFDYRGSWGSPGDFSFTHSLEDTQSAVAYIRDPTNAKKLRADPSHVVLIGHSMGGFTANFTAGADPQIEGLVMISAANLGSTATWPEGAAAESLVHRIAASLVAEGVAPLAGCTPEGLAHEIIANAPHWNIVANAPKLAARPVLVITSDDGLQPTNKAFVDAVKAAGGAKINAIHMSTDHSYSDHRIALESAVVSWLDALQENASDSKRAESR